MGQWVVKECLPILKDAEDRQEVLDALFDGKSVKFIYGDNPVKPVKAVIKEDSSSIEIDPARLLNSLSVFIKQLNYENTLKCMSYQQANCEKFCNKIPLWDITENMVGLCSLEEKK